MLRRSLFACALMLAGVVGFASSAKAGTATVQLGMTVPTSCSFGPTSTPGLLQLATPTTFTTATPATIGISCNGAATLQVAAPVLVTAGAGPSTFTTTSATATLNSKTVTSGNPPINIGAADNGPISVSMGAISGATIQAGIYNFDVLLTSTP